MQCLHPLEILNPKFKFGVLDVPKMLVVGCGRCEGCASNQVSAWSFRLEKEAERHIFGHFVTLTYDPAFVPLTPAGLPTLDKSDVQKYIKRLRKNESNIKYFAVGEYGTKSYRPHYHIIIFGCAQSENIREAWSLEGVALGNVHVGSDLHNGAVGYSLKYMYKRGLIPQFNGDDRLKEFRLMSQKLGDNYLTDANIRWHLADWPNRQYVRFRTGHFGVLSRFYRDRMLKYARAHDVKFKPIDSWRSSYMTSDESKRPLKWRIGRKKQMEKLYNADKNQQNRNKL